MTELGFEGLELLLATPEGRRYMLSVTVDAEEGDEAGLFDTMADVVGDADLSHMLLRHKSDEERHARLFRGCLERNGWTKMDLPRGVSVLDHIGADRDSSIAMTREEAIVLFASTLLAIEERGVERFPMIAEAFDAHDRETAEVYRRVARDERGHVRYCHRLGRRFADDETWAAAVARARALESDAFAKAHDAGVEHVVAQGWLASA